MSVARVARIRRNHHRPLKKLVFRGSVSSTGHANTEPSRHQPRYRRGGNSLLAAHLRPRPRASQREAVPECSLLTSHGFAAKIGGRNRPRTNTFVQVSRTGPNYLRRRRRRSPCAVQFSVRTKLAPRTVVICLRREKNRLDA